MNGRRVFLASCFAYLFALTNEPRSPPNTFQPIGTVCKRTSSSESRCNEDHQCVEDVFECTKSSDCTGAEACATAHCRNNKCTYSPSSEFHVCREARSSCDVVEKCDGKSLFCPADEVKPRGAICRMAAGECDEHEYCDGDSALCPADEFKSPVSVCRTAKQPCEKDAFW